MAAIMIKIDLFQVDRLCKLRKQQMLVQNLRLPFYHIYIKSRFVSLIFNALDIDTFG